MKITARDSVFFEDAIMFSTVEAGATGKGGDIEINTASFSIKGNARILARNNGGRGNAGSVTINASDTIYVEAFKGNGNATIASDVWNGGVGNGNNVNITAGTVVLDNDAVIAASIINGKGEDGKFAQAGNVNVIASDRVLLKNRGRMYSEVGSNSVGYGGTINITAPLVSLDNAYLITRIKEGGQGRAGGINITTKTLLAKNTQILASTDGKGDAGNIQIKAPESITVSGGGSFISAQTRTSGTGGNLTLDTGKLTVRDGAFVSAGTLGAGKGGNLNVNAQTVQVIGASADGKSFSSLSTQASSSLSGDAGGLTINTQELLISDGAKVDASTYGAGDAGDLNVNSTQRVKLSGTSLDGKSRSGLLAVAFPGAKGKAGNITITTGELLVENGAEVSAKTFSPGDGGKLTVTATDKIELIGRSLKNNQDTSGLFTETGKGQTGNGGDLKIDTPKLLVRDKAEIRAGTNGASKGGNINITTRQLTISDRAQVTAKSQGSGNAGSIEGKSDRIFLNRGATINADTTGGGGNINLRSPLLILRRGSSITTNANGSNITGGKININAQNGFIVTYPKENSDIRADSVNFRGGDITINKTAGIFNIQARQKPRENTNDITVKGATPDLGGNLEINRPQVDPSRTLVELPTNIVDASSQISDTCSPGTRQFDNQFVSKGRGGLPMSPTQPLQENTTLSAWVRLRAKPLTTANTTIEPQPTAISTTSVSTATPIVEASGWVSDASGNIELVAQAHQINPHNLWQTPASCRVSHY